MITGISINNYKSIHELHELTFGKINFLIGMNGVGKSNLISAIELTKRLALGLPLQTALSQIAPYNLELFSRGSNKSSATICLQFKDNDNTRFELKYTISVNQQQLIISDEKLSIFEGSGYKDIYIRSLDTFSAREDNATDLNKVPFSFRNNSLAIASYRNNLVLKAVNNITSIKVLWFGRVPNDFFFRVHRMDSLDKSNLDGLVIYLHEQKLDSFNKAVEVIKQIIPDFSEPSIVKVSPPRLEDTKKEGEAKPIDSYLVYWGDGGSQDIAYTLTGLSDGNYRIIQLIFAMFDSEFSSCLIGEELENGQHYGRIKTLIEVLKHLSIKLDTQLLFSTHSRELLGNVPASDVIYCTKDDNGYSKYQPLSEAVDIGMVSEELKREPTTKELLDLGMV